MNKVAESIQRLKKEVIALNKELLELEEAYVQEQKVNDLLREGYNHTINISREDYDRMYDEYIECLKSLGL